MFCPFWATVETWQCDIVNSVRGPTHDDYMQIKKVINTILHICQCLIFQFLGLTQAYTRKMCNTRVSALNVAALQL